MPSGKEDIDDDIKSSPELVERRQRKKRKRVDENELIVKTHRGKSNSRGKSSR